MPKRPLSGKEFYSRVSEAIGQDIEGITDFDKYCLIQARLRKYGLSMRSKKNEDGTFTFMVINMADDA